MLQTPLRIDFGCCDKSTDILEQSMRLDFICGIALQKKWAHLTCVTRVLESPAESVAISSPSCRSRGTQGRRVDKKTTGNTGSRTSPPRTQEETLHLIRLRDEMINAKHTEVCISVYERAHHPLQCSGGVRANPCFAPLKLRVLVPAGPAFVQAKPGSPRRY